jgi:hypothetical protein
MTETLSKNFQYEPLLGSEIRLLKIKPNNGSGPLECQILHYDLKPEAIEIAIPSDDPTQKLLCRKKPRYHALSYVWGSGGGDTSIILNGCLIQIKSSLYYALFRIQKLFRSGIYRDLGSTEEQVLFDLARGSRLLWVDAICINQSDIEEKSHQISRMGDIYREASDVIAWLGEPDEQDLPHVELWFKAVPILWHLDGLRMQDEDNLTRLKVLYSLANDNNPKESIVNILGHIMPPQVYQAYCNGTLEEIFHGADLRSSLAAIGKGLALVLDNPWFKRIWTLQEALLARSSGLLNILIGEFWCDIRLIAAAKIYLSALPDLEADKFWGTYTGAMSLINSYMEFNVDKYHEDKDAVGVAYKLNSMLRLTNGRSASVLHDHIYGFLGLIDSSKLPESLKPNYDLPHEEVWHKYIVFVVEMTGDLNRLSCFGRELNGLPNWVPDFRRFRKTSKTEFESSFVSFSDDGRHLRALGVVLGRVIATFAFGKHNLLESGGADSWPLQATYEASERELRAFNDNIVSNACESGTYSPEDVLKSILADTDDPTRYTSLSDLLLERVHCEHSLPVAESEEVLNTERQRRRDCITLANHLSSLPFYLTDRGMIIQEDHMHDGHESAVGDIICVFKGSNWPWRLRQLKDCEGEYSLMCDTVGFAYKPKDQYHEAYFEDKHVEEFIVV